MEVNEPIMPYGILALTMNPHVLYNAIEANGDFQQYLAEIKEYTDASDDSIANWLNVNVKTYRTYRLPSATLRPDIQEHILILMALVRHGITIFGSPKSFGLWLNTTNFMLGQKPPSDLLNTNSGVRLVDDRLSGIEYGDNS